MKKKLLACMVFCCCTLTCVADDQADITVNGVYENKAILLIKGKPILLEQGQSKQGVKLIHVSKNEAIIEIKGKRKTLFLDKTIAEKYTASNTSLSKESVKTHIVSIDLLQQTPSLATFEVDYYYDGEYGDYVTLSAKTYYENQPTQFSTHTYTRLNTGRNQLTITIGMNEKSPSAYLADQVRFEIHWASEDSSGVLDFNVFEFPKHWKR